MVLAKSVCEHSFQTCILVEMVYHLSEFLFIICQCYCIDKVDEQGRYLVIPYIDIVFYLHNHNNVVLRVITYAAIRLRISFIFLFTRLTMRSWCSVFLLHTPLLCTTFIFLSEISIVSMRLPSMVAERIRESAFR